MKTNAGVFKFLQFGEGFRKAPCPWSLILFTLLIIVVKDASILLNHALSGPLTNNMVSPKNSLNAVRKGCGDMILM